MVKLAKALRAEPVIEEDREDRVRGKLASRGWSLAQMGG